MKKLFSIIGATAVVILTSTPVAASNTPNFRVQIFPLECSLDSVALGNANTLQLTPENCLDGPPEPPLVVQSPSPGTHTLFFPNGENKVLLQNPISQIPSPNFPVSDLKGPLIIDSNNTKPEKTIKQQRIGPIAIGAGILISAGVLAAVHAAYTGMIAPIAAQGGISKIRFPWSKK